MTQPHRRLERPYDFVRLLVVMNTSSRSAVGTTVVAEATSGRPRRRGRARPTRSGDATDLVERTALGGDAGRIVRVRDGNQLRARRERVSDAAGIEREAGPRTSDRSAASARRTSGPRPAADRIRAARPARRRPARAAPRTPGSSHPTCRSPSSPDRGWSRSAPRSPPSAAHSPCRWRRSSATASRAPGRSSSEHARMLLPARSNFGDGRVLAHSRYGA